MQMYVGITDRNWYEQLKEARADEVNFWKPGTTPFRALTPGEMFLFKLHSPHNFIVGGGFFVRYSLLPTFLAWEAFEKKNGVRSLGEFNARISKYRNNCNIEPSTEVGCIILTDCFWLEEYEWIPIPENWSKNIVSGRCYTDADSYGNQLFSAVQDRLIRHTSSNTLLAEQQERYSTGIARHRLGQGAFRILVTDAYQRRCAITGEKTLPVLEAAHIKPYAEEGPHSVNNGILLKSDFHTLYDNGYMTITPDFHIEVSRKLHEDYGNGKDYYKYHGSKLLILPGTVSQRPSAEYLDWHNQNVYLG